MNTKNEQLTITLVNMISAFILLLAAMQASKNADRSSRKFDSITNISQSIFQRYGAKISLRFVPEPENSDHDAISASNTGSSETEKLLRLVESEMALYPVKLVRTALMKRIVLCENLIQNNKSKGAITDFSHGILYLDTGDVNLNDGTDNEANKILDLHHEFFHMIDALDDGSLEDDSWEQMNDPSFHYGADQKGDWSEIPGFVSRYSMSDCAEDKAELFSHMIGDCYSLRNRAKTDYLIHVKMLRIQSLLFKYSSDLNPAFWARVFNHRSTSIANAQNNIRE